MTQIKTYTEKKTGQTTYWFSHYAGRDASGKRQMLTKRGFPTYVDAEFALAKLKIELQKNTYQKKQTIPFREVYAAWERGYRHTVRPTTLDRTLQQFDKYILPEFGAKDIKSITLNDCQEALNAWSATYVNFKVLKSCVQRVLDYAVRAGYRTDNPMRAIQMPRKQPHEATLLGEPPVHYYTATQLHCFLTTVREHCSLMDYALFRLLAYSGMRKGEALGLMWSDIDENAQTVRVQRSLYYLDGQNHIGPPKTKYGQRLITLDADTLAALKEWQSLQAYEFSELGIPTLASDAWVFTRVNKRLKKETLYQKYPDTIIQKVRARQPDLPPITPHGFRHTHAAILLEAGANLKEIQERLGHASIQTTMDTYGHLTQNARKNTAERFARALAESTPEHKEDPAHWHGLV